MQPHSSEQLVGTPVGAEPAKMPERVALHGEYVAVVPLEGCSHSESLWRHSSGKANEPLWTYLFDGPFANRDEFHSGLERKAAATDAYFYALIDTDQDSATGYASLMRIERAHRCIEVGNILYTSPLQRTRGATEAMYLLARYVFEELGYRRYEWKCDALNAKSRRAALRLGFCFEGIFRQHMIVKGRNRDTAWFSMLDSEWPRRKANFERWLDPANFDKDGRQIESLFALNAPPAE